MAAIGSVIDGKYEILKLIGKGGMSRVYLAMDKRLNKQWAVKEIQKNARDKNNSVVVASAIAEANMIKKLDHPSLPRIVDIIDAGNVIYVVMDYIEGEPLSKVLDKEGAQPQELVIEWAKELCGVLQYLHTREPAIIYRDMKPANVMLKPDGSLKLIDFGIAREYKVGNAEDTTSLGTRGYAAPEQFGGKGQTDARTDIYCLGVTLYHLVTGKNPCEPPYELYPIRHWNPSLSSGFEYIIQKCTQVDPINRYQSCAELLYDLEHYNQKDIDYKIEQQKKLKKFIGSAVATVSCVLIACIMLVINSLDVTNRYEEAITAANDSSKEFYVANSESNEDTDARVNKYLTAIELKPKMVEPYNGILDACKAEKMNSNYDNVSVDEAMSCLKTAAEKNLIDQDAFGKFSYDVAEYYMFISQTSTQKDMKESERWLKYATNEKYANTYEEYDDAKDMLSLVESYNQSKIWAQTDDKTNILNYFSDLSGFIQKANSIKKTVTKKSFYQIVLIALHDGDIIHEFNNNGITKNQIESILNDIEDSIDEFTADDKQQMQTSIKYIEDLLNIEYK